MARHKRELRTEHLPQGYYVNDGFPEAHVEGDARCSRCGLLRRKIPGNRLYGYNSGLPGSRYLHKARVPNCRPGLG